MPSSHGNHSNRAESATLQLAELVSQAKVNQDTGTLNLADLLHGEVCVSESVIGHLQHFADKHKLVVQMYSFSELLPDEPDLSTHVKRQLEQGTVRGPFDEDTFFFMSSQWMKVLQIECVEDARNLMSKWWGGGSNCVGRFWIERPSEASITPIHPAQEWNTFVKNVRSGNYKPFRFPGLIWGQPHGQESKSWSIVSVPVCFVSEDGKRRSWGMIRQSFPNPECHNQKWSLWYLQMMKNTPAVMTIVSAETGSVLRQNTSSMALYGNHGSLDSLDGGDVGTSSASSQSTYAGNTGAQGNSSAFDASNSREEINPARGFASRFASPFASLHQQDGPKLNPSAALFPADDGSEDGLSFLQLLFLGHDEEFKRLKSTVEAEAFNFRLELKSRRMRSWMMILDPMQEIFHDVQIVCTVDPWLFQRIYIISQTDVTDTVKAQRQVMEANARLAKEQERMQAVLQRQYELIEVLQQQQQLTPSNGATPASASQLNSFNDKIRILKEIITSTKSDHQEPEEISLHRLLGQGQFGKVYLGTWRGTTVAVKRMVLPAEMSNTERAHKMAVMEIGISSSMVHPHLVQTYTYSIKAIQDENVAAIGPSTCYELRLVLEYCNKGSLSNILADYGGFKDETGQLDYAAVLETAADIAKGMFHLHKNNICHNDLKASNVMFKSEGDDGRGVRAKVVDFGLSVKLDPTATHTSNAFQGTVSHMAPEVMMLGKQSKSADVYSFGITLWELISGGSPYKGLPPSAVCQLVVFQHKRPAWPETTPPDYKALAEACWQPKVEARPSFESILEQLIRMRAGVKERSRPIDLILSRKPVSHNEAAQGPPPLGLSELASIDEDMVMDSWFPTIAGSEASSTPHLKNSSTPHHNNPTVYNSINDSLRSWVPSIMESVPSIPQPEVWPAVDDELQKAPSGAGEALQDATPCAPPSPPSPSSPTSFLKLSDLSMIAGASERKRSNNLSTALIAEGQGRGVSSPLGQPLLLQTKLSREID